MREITLFRFMLFGGESYYAKGGLHDFVGSFDSLEHALVFAENPTPEPLLGMNSSFYINGKFDLHCWDWWHLFDSKEQTIVAQSDTQAYGADSTKDSRIFEVFED